MKESTAATRSMATVATAGHRGLTSVAILTTTVVKEPVCMSPQKERSLR